MIKSLRNCSLIGLAIWLAAFCLGLLPYAGIQTWKINRRTHTTGVFSNHHVVRGKTDNVFATLDFDRPNSTGFVHCKIDSYKLGRFNTEPASDTSAQFAVRDDSCAEAIRLPLSTPDNLWGWVRLFSVGSIYAALGACLLGFSVKLDSARRRKAPPCGPAPNTVS